MSCGEQYVDCWWNNGQEDARKDYRGKRRKSDLGHRRVIFLGPDLPLCKCSTNPSLLGLMHAATTWAPSNLNMRAATDESLTLLNKKCESGRGWNLKLAFASEFEHCSIELSLPSLGKTHLGNARLKTLFFLWTPSLMNAFCLVFVMFWYSALSYICVRNIECSKGRVPSV